jgi:hypothetical protein
MKKMERDKDVLSVSFFPVHLWIDEPELGYATIAITDGKRDLAQQKADQLADMAWAVRDVPEPATHTARRSDRNCPQKTFRTPVWHHGFLRCIGCGRHRHPRRKHLDFAGVCLIMGSDLTSYLTMRDEEAATLQAWQHLELVKPLNLYR